MQAPREFLQAIIRGRIDDVREALDATPELATALDDTGKATYPVVCAAVASGRTEVVRLLLEKGASPTAPLGDDGRPAYVPPLEHAVRLPHPELVELLAELGADLSNPLRPDLLHGIASSGNSALFERVLELGFDMKRYQATQRHSVAGACIAVQAYNSESAGSTLDAFILRLLDLGASLEPRRADGADAPVLVALQRERFGLLEQLLERGASPAPLQAARHALRERLVLAPRPLLERILPPEQDLNNLDERGFALAHHAAQQHRLSTLEFLLERGIDVDLPTAESGATPLMQAISSETILNRLLAAGADINAVDNGGQTLLDHTRGKPGLSRIAKHLNKLGAKTRAELTAESSSGKERLLHLIAGRIDPAEPWAKQALADLSALSESDLEPWLALIEHWGSASTSKPSKRWLQTAGELIAAAGEPAFRERAACWLALLKEPRSREDRWEYPVADGRLEYVAAEYGFTPTNTTLLKGLLWSQALFGGKECADLLRATAKTMFAKLQGVGMRNPTLGNAAITALALMPGDEGVEALALLHTTTKYRPAWVNIDRVFRRAAEERKTTVEQLAQSAVPDFGLTRIGRLEQRIGDATAVVELDRVGHATLSWLAADGSARKTPPTEIKTRYSSDIKALKATIKELQTASSAQSTRIEQLYLACHDLDVISWRRSYLDHPVVGFIARRLIWTAALDNGQELDLLPRDDGYIDVAGNSAELPSSARIRLWHPALREVWNVLAWRALLERLKIVQPFKQAHREVYLLTNAERESGDHSRRFAGHALKQSQFHALAGQRGWQQARGGSYDGGDENDAWKKLPAYGLRVRFEASGIQELGYTAYGMYECVASGSVRYSRLDDEMAQPLQLTDIDPLVLSETLRDIDLFVGVCSVSNDPAWEYRDAALGHWWQNNAFGELTESAEMRRTVLEQIIPKLKIGPRLQLEDRYLKVRGKCGEYKIHLGSANVVMNSGRYLCIVPRIGASTTRIHLPFEGDHMLSLILSKAMLLADDDKIRDKSILSQLQDAPEAG